MDMMRGAATAAALGAALAVAGCAGGAAGDEAWIERQCRSRGLAQESPGWQDCIAAGQAELRGYRAELNRARGP